MRLFTGLALPADISTAVAKLCQDLRSTAPSKLSWTPIEKLHITTKFIGEFPEEHLPELRQALSLIGGKPIDIRLSGLAWLPSALCAAVGEAEPLSALVSATESTLEPLGVPREKRRYRPHVTLARVRHTPGPGLGTFRAMSTKNPVETMGVFRATTFCLYLSASGKYTKLNEFNFSRE
jgi:2'-5' RNA ligase